MNIGGGMTVNELCSSGIGMNICPGVGVNEGCE